MIRVTVDEHNANGLQVVDKYEMDLPEFPKAGDFVLSPQGKLLRVWHAVLQATKDGGPSTLKPGLLVDEAQQAVRPPIVAVSGQPPSPPVPVTLYSRDNPRNSGTWYVTRMPIVGDGLDLNVDTGPLGHEVREEQGAGFLVVEEPIIADLEPDGTPVRRLPKRPRP